MQELPDIYTPWLKFRESRQQALIAVLNKASTSGGISKAELKAVLLDSNTPYAREFEPYRVNYWQNFAFALEDIDSWATKAQRQRAVTRLRDYAQVAERLGNQS